ncbi:MAG: hypothetical protein IT318_20320 [Anaerolineales bacterium]|nr:hypothetical protein [Anaerolineales bacterium]
MVSTFPDQQFQQPQTDVPSSATTGAGGGAGRPAGMDNYTEPDPYAAENLLGGASAADAAPAATEGEPDAAPAPAPAATPSPSQWDTPDNPYFKQWQDAQPKLQQIDALQQRVDTWQQQIDAAQQGQQRQQFQQAQQELLNDLAAWATAYRELHSADIPADKFQRYQQALQYGLAFQQPDVQQRFNAVYEAANTFAARDKAWELVGKHFGDTASYGTIRQAFEQVVKSASPEIMEERTQLLADRWRQSNAQRRVQSGAERLEGGAPAAAGAPNSLSYYENKIFRAGGGTDALTDQEWARYLELRQRSAL